MDIKIEPYTIKTNLEKQNNSITYWKVLLDDQEVSCTSTKDKAEDTKQWMENWLTNTH